MCWYCVKPNKRLANEDIPVFKIVTEDLKSYYYDFKYKIGESYATRINLEYIGGYYTTHEGFHSYSIECRDKKHSFGQIIVERPNGKFLDLLVTGVRLNCIIPKGAEYYVNNKGEYVSNQIKPICVG